MEGKLKGSLLRSVTEVTLGTAAAHFLKSRTPVTSP